MRIFQAAQNYLQPNNGQAVFASHLAEGLARGGHEVEVLTPSDQGRPYRREQRGVHIAGVRSVALAPFYPDVVVSLRPDLEVGALLDEFRPHVVHVQDHFPVCRAVVRQALERGLPIVATNHFMPQNIIPFVPVLSRFAITRAWMERLMWGMVVEVFRHADVVTTPTETAADLLRAAFARGSPRPRDGPRDPPFPMARDVRALSCGVDLGAFHVQPDIDRKQVRERYGIPTEQPVMFFIGRVDREKRLDVLLRALHLLAQGRERNPVQLAIAGRGRDEDGFRVLARDLGLDDRVRFLGFVPESDVTPLLNSVDIFAMPSEAELQSIATLEAMATGRPILASDACALPELVQEGVNGCLFRAGDVADAARAVERLLELKDHWPELGRESARIARGHDLGQTVRRYEALYREVDAGRMKM